MSIFKSRLCIRRSSAASSTSSSATHGGTPVVYPVNNQHATPVSSRRVSEFALRRDSSLNLRRFEIEKIIGKGQFSEVSKALDKKTGEWVALKKICIFDIVDVKSRQDCMREINLLQQLDHPNIIKILGCFIDSNDLYIVLELAGGGDLSKLINYYARKGKLIPERKIWEYFHQIADALAHMHDKRVMHRDIKPANIFTTESGVMKLGDLGLGRFLSAVTKVVASIVGTPYYMSPERMKEERYDFKSDIWSMGCILYELAALHSPFYGEKMNLYSLIQKIETCSYPPLPYDGYSSQLKETIAACLSLDPNQRPSAKELAAVARRMCDYMQQSSSDILTRC